MTEPRFLLIDLHKKESVTLTTDQVQAALWRLEIKQPSDAAYFEKRNDSTTSKPNHPLPEM